MLKLLSYKKKLLICLFSSLIFCTLFGSNLMAFSLRPAPILNPVNLHSKNVHTYKSYVSGSSYSWKLLCAIPLSRPSHKTAIKNLWKNSGISKTDQNKYDLVNIRTTRGTDWSIVWCGEDYLTITASIIRK
ncbi:MAG: hypothetical protein GY756_11540 [bacterium]|nr:hypothetical protein [bacterium]